jgi:hypothetical protein
MRTLRILRAVLWAALFLLLALLLPVLAISLRPI